MQRETRIALTARRSADSPLPLRNPTEADQAQLADLLYAAYSDSPESEGETREGCQEEIGFYFNGTYGEPRLSCSFVAFDEAGTLVAACLVLIDRGTPLIAYLCTRPEWRRRGIARAMLAQTLKTLRLENFDRCAIRVGVANEPAQRLLQHFIFARPDGEYGHGHQP